MCAITLPLIAPTRADASTDSQAAILGTGFRQSIAE